MPLFRKKPVEVEAYLYDGSDVCKENLSAWIDQHNKTGRPLISFERVAVYAPIDNIHDEKMSGLQG